MQKYIFFFESQIFVPIFVPLPSALLISESRKQSVVKSVFLCLFTVLCMAVLSNSVDMSKKKRENRNIFMSVMFHVDYPYAVTDGFTK